MAPSHSGAGKSVRDPLRGGTRGLDFDEVALPERELRWAAGLVGGSSFMKCSCFMFILVVFNYFARGCLRGDVVMAAVVGFVGAPSADGRVGQDDAHALRGDWLRRRSGGHWGGGGLLGMLGAGGREGVRGMRQRSVVQGGVCGYPQGGNL